MADKQASEAIATIVDEQSLNLLDMCCVLGSSVETVTKMVDYGIVEPIRECDVEDWEFSTLALKRTRIAMRLQRDLQVNLENLDLVLNLLEEVQQLRRRVQFFTENYPEL